MDKGWGLTLDSDPIPNFFNSKTPPPQPPSSHPFFSLKREMFQFPVSLSGSRDRDDPPAGSAASPPSDEHRVPEVDFFSGNKISSRFNVKKENSHGDAGPSSEIDRVNIGLHLLTANTGSDESTVDDGVSSEIEDKRPKSELAQLQVELQKMNSENQRLRDMLSQVSSNYNSLQMHFMALMQQQQQNHASETPHEHEIVEAKSEEKKHGGMVPRQFMDLGPSGTVETEENISQSSSEERTRSDSPPNNEVASKDYAKNNGKNEVAAMDQDLKRRDGSPDSEGWGPNKMQKLNPGPAAATPKVDQAAAEATMRKARVSVRARSEAPMISDGCQWRKYGQKMAKGNPCPRAYYRCTMAVGCPVRKQVQRCAEDRTILITTYEGNHNHPLPPAAMAMASTTTAAASMLLSGSMSSADGLMNPNLLARAILPCSSSMATISASAPFPTVTLDLTHSPNPLQFQRAPAQFQVPFPGQPQNIGSVQQLPQVFGQALYNQSKFSGLQLSQDMGSGSSSQLVHGPPPAQLHQQPPPTLADTVSAATAAITADPNFTAALVAAISSIIGGGHHNNSNTSNNGNGSKQ